MRTLIIAISTIVVAATVGTILVGNRTFDGLVNERPYEAGLAWDETQKKQARLGWRVEVDTTAIKVGKNDVRIRLYDKAGSPVEGAAVVVTVSRPSTREYDRTYSAIPLGGGRYQVSLNLPVIGGWDLRTDAARDTDVFTSSERIEAGK